MVQEWKANQKQKWIIYYCVKVSDFSTPWSLCISCARLCSKQNWREPSALKLKNLGYPAYDLYEKTKVFRSAESKSLATDHQALLEHSPAVILVRRICSMTVKTLFTCQPFKFTFLLNRHLATNYFGLSVGRLFHRSSCQLWKILCSMATKMVTTSRFACWSFSYFVTFIFDWTHRQ